MHIFIYFIYYATESLLSLPKRWLSTQGYGGDDDEFQNVQLPKLPVPDLQATMDSYLEFAAVVVSPQQVEHTRGLVRGFMEELGPTLQEMLLDRQREMENWSVDEATNDEHLLDVMLKLLKSLCICMHETLKEKESNLFTGDTNYLKDDDKSQTSSKEVLDLYTKMYNSTCFNLREDLVRKINKMHDLIKDNGESEIMRKSTCGKKMKVTTEKVIPVTGQTVRGVNKSNLSNILFKTFIETRQFHKYKLNNLFTKSQSLSPSDTNHSVIIILTLHPKTSILNDTSNISHVVSDIDFTKTLNTESPIDIVILETTNSLPDYKKKQKGLDDNMSECQLRSIYNFLLESEQKNSIKVFKLIKKKGTIIMYLHVITMRNYTDYSRAGCNEDQHNLNKTFVMQSGDRNKTKKNKLLETISETRKNDWKSVYKTKGTTFSTGMIKYLQTTKNNKQLLQLENKNKSKNDATEFEILNKVMSNKWKATVKMNTHLSNDVTSRRNEIYTNRKLYDYDGSISPTLETIADSVSHRNNQAQSIKILFNNSMLGKIKDFNEKDRLLPIFFTQSQWMNSRQQVPNTTPLNKINNKHAIITTNDVKVDHKTDFWDKKKNIFKKTAHILKEKSQTKTSQLTEKTSMTIMPTNRFHGIINSNRTLTNFTNITSAFYKMQADNRLVTSPYYEETNPTITMYSNNSTKSEILELEKRHILDIDRNDIKKDDYNEPVKFTLSDGKVNKKNILSNKSISSMLASNYVLTITNSLAFTENNNIHNITNIKNAAHQNDSNIFSTVKYKIIDIIAKNTRDIPKTNLQRLLKNNLYSKSEQIISKLNNGSVAKEQGSFKLLKEKTIQDKINPVQEKYLTTIFLTPKHMIKSEQINVNIDEATSGNLKNIATSKESSANFGESLFSPYPTMDKKESKLIETTLNKRQHSNLSFNERNILPLITEIREASKISSTQTSVINTFTVKPLQLYIADSFMNKNYSSSITQFITSSKTPASLSEATTQTANGYKWQEENKLTETRVTKGFPDIIIDNVDALTENQISPPEQLRLNFRNENLYNNLKDNITDKPAQIEIVSSYNNLSLLNKANYKSHKQGKSSNMEVTNVVDNNYDVDTLTKYQISTPEYRVNFIKKQQNKFSHISKIDRYNRENIEDIKNNEKDIFFYLTTNSYKISTNGLSTVTNFADDDVVLHSKSKDPPIRYDHDKTTYELKTGFPKETADNNFLTISPYDKKILLKDYLNTFDIIRYNNKKNHEFTKATTFALPFLTVIPEKQVEIHFQNFTSQLPSSYTYSGSPEESTIALPTITYYSSSKGTNTDHHNNSIKKNIFGEDLRTSVEQNRKRNKSEVATSPNKQNETLDEFIKQSNKYILDNLKITTKAIIKKQKKPFLIEEIAHNLSKIITQKSNSTIKTDVLSQSKNYKNKEQITVTRMLSNTSDNIVTKSDIFLENKKDVIDIKIPIPVSSKMKTIQTTFERQRNFTVIKILNTGDRRFKHGYKDSLNHTDCSIYDYKTDLYKTFKISTIDNDKNKKMINGVDKDENNIIKIESNKNLTQFKNKTNVKTPVLDTFAKINLYPIKKELPKTRKVMKTIKLAGQNKGILTMNTKDFFAHRRSATQRAQAPVSNNFYIPQPFFFHTPTIASRHIVLKPKFNKIDRRKPKPDFRMLKVDDNIYRDDYRPHRTKLSWKDKVNFMQQVFDKVSVTQKSIEEDVLIRPEFLQPTEPRLLRDRVNYKRRFLKPIINKHTTTSAYVWRAPPPYDSVEIQQEFDLEFPFSGRYQLFTTSTTKAVTLTTHKLRPMPVTEWWLDDMYLKVRVPLPINSNPGMVFPKRHFAKMDEVADLGALFIDDLLDYKEMLDRGELPLERATSREKGQPLCMEQFYRLLGVCRIPEVGKDRLEFPQMKQDGENEELIVVACRNYFYPIPVKAADRGRLTPGEIQAQLLHVMVDAAGAPAAPRVGLLTSMQRDQWARAREQLIKGRGTIKSGIVFIKLTKIITNYLHRSLFFFTEC
ncbi:unnamed protein product [Diatraea saccharalis]|uniref:Choline/carnitine acyltransferase domain-containing protein n=1 Tax=Diatraea saccharalis TaxID=40085 RepID=A0A9N9R1A5_9NEOP|nr:unnamed protein product [Diatraea saccharalis]